jgi:hypothetical protein
MRAERARYDRVLAAILEKSEKKVFVVRNWQIFVVSVYGYECTSADD